MFNVPKKRTGSQKYHSSGFTLIEIVVSFAILTTIALTIFICNTKEIHRRNVEAERNLLVRLLMDARQLSILNEGKGFHGVHIASTTYTVFEGKEFGKEEPSNTVYRHRNLLIEGSKEIIFEPLSGAALLEADITLHVGDESSIITVNREGAIEWGK